MHINTLSLKNFRNYSEENIEFTPGINLFRGTVRDEQLLIGGEAMLSAKGVKDGPVIAGIRPEGFLLNPQGAFSCSLERIEVMGRDTSIVSHHRESINDTIRSIIFAENTVDPEADTVRFDLKPAKVFLFDPESEVRIPVAVVQDGGE